MSKETLLGRTVYDALDLMKTNLLTSILENKNTSLSGLTDEHVRVLKHLIDSQASITASRCVDSVLRISNLDK